MSQAEDTQITVYSGNHQGALSTSQLQNAHNIPGFAVINETREVNLQKGRFVLSIDDVAAHIDPTTVTLRLQDRPGDIQVLDQNFQFDLVSTEKLLLRYLDQSITVNHDRGNESIDTEGILLSTEGGLTLKTGDQKITTIRSWNQIDFPALPGGLLTKPTLVWLLDSKTGKNGAIDLSYQTRGMTWWVDYNLVLHDNNGTCRMDLSSWVTLINKSGASYQQAGLKLIAGDVNRVEPNRRQPLRRETLAMAADSQFSEESLYEYHMYRLPRKVDLPNNSTKQIPLIQGKFGLNCEHRLVYNGSRMNHIIYQRPVTDRQHRQQSNSKVDAFLTFVNSQNNQLGIPLPAGRMRVNAFSSSDGSSQFIGEDQIDHTPDNKTISLQLGQSFDVTGSRTQTDFSSQKNSLTEQFTIVLDNQKNQPQTIEVIEPMFRWSNWQLTEQSEPHEQLDASTIRFTVEVPAKSQKSLTYRVRYQWENN